MKVAIIHDIYLHSGGAERVLETLVQAYPNSDIYVSLIAPQYRQRLKKLSRGKVYSSIFNYLPFKKKYASLLKPLVFLYWKSLNLNEYDLVISSSHSFSSKSVKIHKIVPHISYIYTPPRYLYEEFNEMSWIKKSPWKMLLKPILNWLRKNDLAGAKNPDLLIASSHTIQKRIKKYYQRDSIVIYPPVRISDSIPSKKEGQYYLFMARLARQKGGDLVIKTFNLLGKKLVVVGTGMEEKHLKKIAGKNISFRGFVPDDQMPAIYKQAKALINCSIEEDFGIVPIEAMTHGVPVIAYKSGGLAETIINNKTGILFTDYSTQGLAQAINKFEHVTISAKNCYQQAKKFSEERFLKEFDQLVKKYIKE